MKSIHTFYLFLSLISMSFFACENKPVDCRVAVAANMQFVMDDLVVAFHDKTGKNVVYSSASSGQLYAQISKGAPFDLFISADEDFPNKAYADGHALSEPSVYAIGTLILWTQKEIDLNAGIKTLLSPKIKRIAIANPISAPYGIATKEALIHAGIWDQVESKLVFGQSISQVNHYINVKAVDCGLTAYSAIAAFNEVDKGEFILINDSLYTPIRQAMVLIASENASQQATAKSFFEFMQSEQAKGIMAKHGFKN